jgi:uncharacterized protein YecT (DUF1311 family)
MWFLLSCSTPEPTSLQPAREAPADKHVTAPEPTPTERTGHFADLRVVDGNQKTCLQQVQTQLVLTQCEFARSKELEALAARLEDTLSKRHPTLDLTSAYAVHQEAEFAWLQATYARDGSMWPMVRAGHQASFTEDRVEELAYDLCAPRPVFEPAADCYSDAILPFEGFVLCDEATYDKDLNVAYQQLVKGMNKEHGDLFRTSQRAWLAHRDVDTPVCSKMTGNPARVLRVRHRVEQLRAYVEAAEIGG